MTRRVFHDPSRCTGCGDCVVECKQVHGLGPSATLVRVIRRNQLSLNGQSGKAWEWKSCRQCEAPECIPACTKGAIQKRADGIVWIDALRCDFCGDCFPACSIRAIYLDPAVQKAVKCDLCRERIDQGRPPACVVRCEAQALFFGAQEEWETRKGARTGLRLAPEA